MTTMVIPKFMTNLVNALGQDIHFDKFTCKLAKYFFDILQVVIKMTMEVIVGYDLWLSRATNVNY